MSIVAYLIYAIYSPFLLVCLLYTKISKNDGAGLYPLIVSLMVIYTIIVIVVIVTLIIFLIWFVIRDKPETLTTET